MIVVFDEAVRSAQFLHYLWVTNKYVYILNKCVNLHIGMVQSKSIFVCLNSEDHLNLFAFYIQINEILYDSVELKPNFRIALNMISNFVQMF